MKNLLRGIGLLCALLLLFPWAACGEQLPAAAENEIGYAAYLNAIGRPEAAENVISLFEQAEGLPLAEGESVTLTVNVPQDVFGYPVLTYAMTGSNILDNGYTLLVDGQAPYAECTTLTLDSLWTQSSAFEKDRYGNEVVSMPVKSYEITSCRLMGKSGLYSQGMGLYLTAGAHEITILCREGPFILYGMALAGEIPVLEAARGELTGSYLITLQAEQVPVRNNPNIRPLADYDLRLSPYSSDRKVINHIEDISYKYPGDTLTYTFTVEQAGCYAMALRLRQAELANFPVYRTVLVDGAIPGPAFENAEFAYCLSFENQTITDADGKPALMRLDAGEHTLTLLTSADPLQNELTRLEAVSDQIAALALEITKITGGNTDFFRDFALEDFDFHVADDLARWTAELTDIRQALGALAHTDGRVGALSSLDMAVKALEQLAKAPNDLPKKLTLFSQGASSARGFLVSLVESLSTSPMGLDAIYFYTDESLLPGNPGVLQQAADTASRFVTSFTQEDYVANTGDGTRLQVWVNRPRQYLEIMQRMADTVFTPATGVAVDFSIMPDESKLILANASGSAPDVALGVSTTRVYDLAVRGALKNLREYEDFSAVGKWFPTGLLMPAVCDEGMYALPETFNFYVLFYRKDILDSIGLRVPDSYEEVLQMLPTLHRYGLNYNNYVSNVIGYKAFAITTPYLYQAGAVLYRDGDLHVQLDTEAAIEGLKVMTDSFVIYDMDFEVNSFYQSFRDGTLPIGTSNYAMYNLLMNAAPELADKWGIALYPGMTDENGQVQRWTSGAEQSCFIFDNTSMPEEAWQFLSWWMSEETQTEFAYTLQSTLGNEYMWNSANVSAFMNSPWPTEHKKIIAGQMNWIYETPRNPGSYMVERELSNAVNAVCLEGQNLRAALDEAIKRIDRELERKLEEFGRLKDGRLTQPFIVPDINTVKGWLE